MVCNRSIVKERLQSAILAYQAYWQSIPKHCVLKSRRHAVRVAEDERVGAY